MVELPSKREEEREKPEPPDWLEVAAGEAAKLRGSPYAQYQIIRVTFNSTANNNTEIKHNLTPPTPESIDYQVLNWEFSSAPAAAPVVYRDSGATRRAWASDYIVLRCNIASAVADLLLTVRR